MAYPGTRFNTASGADVTFGSEGLALMQVEDLAQGANFTNLNPITSGSSSTATAAAFINSVYLFSGGSTYTLTTPSAAQIVAAIVNCQVGSSFDVYINNQNSGTLTLTAGSGVTFTGGTGGTASIATNKGCIYKGVVTNATVGAETVQLVAPFFAVA